MPRTKTSKWVYRTIVALCAIAASRVAYFSWRQFAEMELEGQFFIFWSLMDVPLVLLLAAIALLLRSAASYWLIGYVAVSSVISVIASVGSQAATWLVLATLAGAAIFLGLLGMAFWVLIRHEEVRFP